MMEAQKERLKLRPPTKMSNIDRIHHMMNFSPFGGMAQVFIIEAIRHYSQAVADQDLGPEPEPDPENMGPSPHYWQKVGRDISRQINEHLNIKKD
jgi:hypothetical protein